MGCIKSKSKKPKFSKDLTISFFGEEQNIRNIINTLTNNKSEINIIDENNTSFYYLGKNIKIKACINLDMDCSCDIAIMTFNLEESYGDIMIDLICQHFIIHRFVPIKICKILVGYVSNSLMINCWPIQRLIIYGYMSSESIFNTLSKELIYIIISLVDSGELEKFNKVRESIESKLTIPISLDDEFSIKSTLMSAVKLSNYIPNF